MNRKVCFESASSAHPSQNNLFNYPPEGYEFVTIDGKWNNSLAWVIRNPIFLKAIRGSARVVPLGLAKPYFNRLLKRQKGEIDLIYAYNQLVFEKVPWVVLVEWIHFLAGFHIRHLWRYRCLIESALASNYCKGILTWSEVARKNILCNLDCRRFMNKIEVVYPAVAKKDFVKRHTSDIVKLLFIGSGRTPDIEDFHAKGGKEVVKMFTLLDRNYHNKVELVMRARVPKHFKNEIKRYKNVRLIEETIPWNVLEQEFKTADIFILPTHLSHHMVIVDAMSYELPIVVTDVYDNPEWVQNGITGFLLRHPSSIPYYWKDFIPSGPTLLKREYARGMRSLQWSTVIQLVKKVSILIEDESLRRRMGKAARREVEEGRFSIQRRNQKLKKIFDEALS